MTLPVACNLCDGALTVEPDGAAASCPRCRRVFFAVQAPAFTPPAISVAEARLPPGAQVEITDAAGAAVLVDVGGMTREEVTTAIASALEGVDHADCSARAVVPQDAGPDIALTAAILADNERIRAEVTAAIAGGAGPFSARDHAMRATGLSRLRCSIVVAHVFRDRVIAERVAQRGGPRSDAAVELELLQMEIVNGLAVRQRAKAGAGPESVRAAQRELAATVRAWGDDDSSADEDAGRGLAELVAERTRAAAVVDQAVTEGLGPADAVALAREAVRDRVAVAAVLDVYRARGLDAAGRAEIAAIDAAVLDADQAEREDLQLEAVIALTRRRAN